MLHHIDVRTLHEQRLRDGRAGLQARAWRAAQPDTPRGRASSLRRRIGRSVVRIGLAIEAEPRRPVASR
jgi:hypothetical protein